MLHECTTENLPPDPETMNDRRAAWIEDALATFYNFTRQRIETDGLQEIISDFLADLGHYCDRHGLNLPDLSTIAAEHYLVETSAKGKQYAVHAEAALLIAAAPAMFALLKEATTGCTQFQYRDWQKRVDNCVAALEKGQP